MSVHNTFETLDPQVVTELNNVISIPNDLLGDIVSDLNLDNIVVTDGAEPAEPIYCSEPVEPPCDLPCIPQEQVS